MEAVLAAPSVWTKYRYNAYVKFLDVVEEDSPTKSDIKILKRRFLENTQEPAVYRIHAAAVLAAQQCFVDGEVNEAVEILHHGLIIINESPPEVVFDPFFIGKCTTVKHILDRSRVEFQANVASYEGNTTLFSQLMAGYTETHGSALSIPREVLYRPFTFEERMFLLPRAIAGGSHCDCCYKNKEQLGMDNLRMCGRCKMVYYCSEACQHKHWKEGGHKRDCRKKGQIKVGDDMLLKCFASQPDFNGRFVKVIERGTAEGTWHVKQAQ